MENSHYLIAYDIADPRRRRILLKVLEDYAYRIQYSVFEMYINERDLARLTDWIEYSIDEEEDSVFIIKLDKDAVKNKLQFGKVTMENTLYDKKYMIL